VAVEESGIRSLQDVPLEEVSNSPLWYPLACSEDGPHDRVTNTYMRCKHEVQLVSELNEPGLACGPSNGFLQKEEEVSVALWTSFHHEFSRPLLRFGVRVVGADLACRTLRTVFHPSVKELATNCESSFVRQRRSDPWLI